MLYEIINMSDAYTIEAKDLELAFVACILLGRGQYALEPLEDDGVKVPFFMFGGIDEFCQKHFSKSAGAVIDGVMEIRGKELADCLDSCLIGGKSNRQTYFDGLALIDDPAKRELWRNRWHEERRSSLNDIGGRAYEIAENLRTKVANPILQAPQQVFAN
jgi:hypothetical protein